MAHELTPAIAQRFAEAALGHVTREYPHKLDHVMDGPEDVLGPRDLHPIFFGSFDWHSCVHGYWLLMRLRRLFPDLPAAPRIDALLDEMIVPEKVAGELDYLDRAYTGGFERPYGWAWALALHREAQYRKDASYADELMPLARAFGDRFKAYLPKLTYPIRVGTHFNTAFAMIHARDWASGHDPELEELIYDRTIDYFARDPVSQGLEPAGDEFLSPVLTVALLMSETQVPDVFEHWIHDVLPGIEEGAPASLFTPASVSDRSDGKIAHLDGLNLSRAWCWRVIADRLDPGLGTRAREAADAHLAASLPHVTGDYMGEHWLATFALLALEQPG